MKSSILIMNVLITAFLTVEPAIATPTAPNQGALRVRSTSPDCTFLLDSRSLNNSLAPHLQFDLALAEGTLTAYYSARLYSLTLHAGQDYLNFLSTSTRGSLTQLPLLVTEIGSRELIGRGPSGLSVTELLTSWQGTFAGVLEVVSLPNGRFYGYQLRAQDTPTNRWSLQGTAFANTNPGSQHTAGVGQLIQSRLQKENAQSFPIGIQLQLERLSFSPKEEGVSEQSLVVSAMDAKNDPVAGLQDFANGRFNLEQEIQLEPASPDMHIAVFGEATNPSQLEQLIRTLTQPASQPRD